MPRTAPWLDRLFLTDAGLETDMVFNRGFDLPFFSSLTLLRTQEGQRELTAYYRGFLDLAARLRTGFILESATWRASADWAEPLGLDEVRLDELNREAVAMLLQLKTEYASPDAPVLVSGCIGPRGDGYDPGRSMSADEASAYHGQQAKVLMDAGADMLSAITMTNIPEAVGIVRAAAAVHAPVVISFTVETDGRLLTGESLSDAIDAVDAATDAYPAYYMINCAHPTHFAPALREGERWTGRIQGVRANASRCSHAELDVMTELDAGEPAELASSYVTLRKRFPHLLVLGGCCGTDLSHVSAIAEACVRA
jgi:S-methylmethionine-dependent homocysteine/selenocysteine methylase